MDKKLVLAEKPSVGRDLAKALNCNKKGNGFMEGEKHIVTWALGHLVTLADPEAYGKQYANWSLEHLPMLPKQLELVVIKQTGKQYNTVKSLMHRKDVREIIIATDAGREGELVARWIIEKANVKKPIKRLWISSVTDKAIKEGFNKLRDGRKYENLYLSAVARAEADWLVGINATRALTTKFNAQLSCGRVQSPTLAIIAAREEEISSFKPKEFYGLKAVCNDITFTWQDSKTKDMKTFDKEKIERIAKASTNQKVEVIDIDKNLKKTYSPGLYDLTELQRDANRIWGYSAKDTLSIMQKLYENHKVLTYPRTDSRFISSDIVETIKDRLKACSVGPYGKLTSKILKNPIKVNKNFVDDSKVSDHHAIIPTEEYVNLTALNDKERKIFDLVVKRFFAVLYPPFEYEQTTISAKVNSEIFTAKGKMVISQGWKEVYDNSFDDESKGTEQDQSLPKVKIAKGDILDISRIEKTSGYTKPPAFFSEGTLLSAMENPSKYMERDNKELVKIIGETGGIGTVATRADIIEKLFNSFLIEKKGKDIAITSKGKQLLELVPRDLKSPTLTAQWEQKLDSIAKGKLNKDKFIEEIRHYTKETVQEIKNSNDKFIHDNITRSKCPECGKYMLEVNGKRGKMLVCQDRDCGKREMVAKVTNARCPNCRKKLELRGEGEGQIFVCPCGHKEKLSAFNERKKQSNTKVSKKDVNKYLKDQNKQKEEPMNSALADALAKLKFDK
ncbi:DNA topoisomerase III [Alkalicella caledoniensis]|uniref:DNA topoisomerase 3 n=1 Tax=Alkalicella caledoniensis TaxID=2731377 RepID=A0A7G9W8S8_ALKCA|nr:DNA topoisomerase III [Alkalicella caledoniensis]QNO15090.1 DNA topoisomerase III [Alkalicella caledoniensis]